MSSSIFTTMLKRQIDLFVATFQNDGNALFKNERTALIHPGEYGMYREQRFRSLLQSFLTRDYSVSDGFIISSVDNNVTTQCDVLVNNAFSPLTNRQRGISFPGKTNCCLKLCFKQQQCTVDSGQLRCRFATY